MLFAGMAAQGESPLSLLLGGSGRLAQPGRHYPLGDIYDSASHTQAYYHRHTDAEFGHLHLFVRPKGMPEGMRPLVATGQADAPCHLAAVVLNGAGQAVELFTTNRWVTGEDWYAAGAMDRGAGHGTCPIDRRSGPGPGGNGGGVAAGPSRKRGA